MRHTWIHDPDRDYAAARQLRDHDYEDYRRLCSAVGDRICGQRQYVLQLTRTELAARAGCTAALLTRWEDGELLPDPAARAGLLAALELSHAQLWDGLDVFWSAEPVE